MFPWVYGFTWQAGDIIFLTIFYTVAGVILITLTTAVLRALRDLESGHVDEIKWYIDFNDLPERGKTCRHVFTGELDRRTCRNGFDCRTCKLHAELTAAGTASKAGAADGSLFGLDMPADRLYHRGHTWVHVEPDGTLMVGLDEFGKHIIGRSTQAELPGPGTKLTVNGTGWFLRSGDFRARVLSPVNGEVVSVGGMDAGYYLRVKPEGSSDLRHLLRGAEIRPWMTRELERLQAALSADRTGVSLADGGELVDDMPANYPDADWENVMGEMFLEP